MSSGTIIRTSVLILTGGALWAFLRHLRRRVTTVQKDAAAKSAPNVLPILRGLDKTDAEILRWGSKLLFDDLRRGGATTQEAAIFLRVFYQSMAATHFSSTPWAMALQTLPDYDGPNRAYILVPFFVRHIKELSGRLSLETQHKFLPELRYDVVHTILFHTVLQAMRKLGTADPSDKTVEEYSTQLLYRPETVWTLINPHGTFDLAHQLLSDSLSDIPEFGGIDLENLLEMIEQGIPPPPPCSCIKFGPNFLYDVDLESIVDVSLALAKRNPVDAPPLCVRLDGTNIYNQVSEIERLISHESIRWVVIYDTPMAYHKSGLLVLARYLKKNPQKLIWIQEHELDTEKWMRWHPWSWSPSDTYATHQEYYKQDSSLLLQ